MQQCNGVFEAYFPRINEISGLKAVFFAVFMSDLLKNPKIIPSNIGNIHKKRKI